MHGIIFYESFTYFITPKFSNLLWECNLSWSNASTNLKDDWLIFRQLHNMSTATIRKAKVDYFLLETSNNRNNKKTFWGKILSLIGSHSNSDFPSCIIKDSCKIVDKAKIIDCWNEHFMAIGTLSESQNLTHDNSSTAYLNHFKLDQLFDFNPLTFQRLMRHLNI